MPAFNAAKTISISIDSIIRQTLSDWELIAINDGSIDETQSILDKYSVLDERISVFHRQNGGVASARQYGINNAHGKYCIHVDADDWVDPDYLEKLVKKAEEINADMVWCDAYRSILREDNITDSDEVWPHNCVEDSREMIRSIMRQKFWACLWNKLFLTSICKREDVYFPVPCQMWEDCAFVCQALLHCRTIAHVHNSLYHYNVGNEESLLHQQQRSNFSSHVANALSRIDEAFKKEKIDEYDYELTWHKLMCVRDYVDDKRVRDYDKFMNTFPDAIIKINNYQKVPLRLKVIAWLISHELKWLCPIALITDALLKHTGLIKDRFYNLTEKDWAI